jgi:GT2 family glycosyltransferase
MTFRHSGKLGDVIYSLPAVRALGGGVLYLNPNEALGFTEAGARSLFPLLRLQSYIEDVRFWEGEAVDVDLDLFRELDYRATNLADCHLLRFGLSTSERDAAWVHVWDAQEGGAIVFARSLDHRGIARFWETCYACFSPRAVFVGTSEEHRVFEAEVGRIRYTPTGDLLELAGIIAGCELFVGNQSCPYAVAEALKKKAILEVDLAAPNCLFARDDVLAVMSEADLAKVATFAAAPLPPYKLEVTGELGPATLAGTSIVVVTYNSAKTVRFCLDALLPTLWKEDEVILVDNASCDTTPELLRGYEAPNVRVVLSEQNLGFSAGTNLGIRLSRGATVCLLNPDAVVRPAWKEGLVSRLADARVGAVGPVSDNVTRDQYIEHHLTGDERMPMTRDQLACRIRLLHAGKSIETKLLIGFCMMLRREVLDEVGLLDEDLFLGSDDLELCLRLRCNGYKLLVAQDVFVQHIGGASFASEPKETVQRLLAESTRVLHAKLGQLFGDRVPSSEELWGIGILPGREAEF